MRRYGFCSRRTFLRTASLAVGASAVSRRSFGAIALPTQFPLEEFSYSAVEFPDGPHERQFRQTQAVLLGLDDDSLMMPFRKMAGKVAPGRDIGGWYRYDPNYVLGKDDAGFAPGHSLGQWISALARGHAITGSTETRDMVARLNQLLAKEISVDYFEKTRFPAYSYDKLVCGLIDAHTFARDADAFSVLDKVTDTASTQLPGKAIERDVPWRPGKDASWQWDESYTLPENLFLAYQRGAGQRYRDMAAHYLMDATFFDPLARGENVLAGRHAYSTVNSLSSAMQAYLSAASEKHLRAARNGYDMVMAQSFATGGWGPDEQLRAPESDGVFTSLTKTHNSFETPCGAYAHFKLTRYLLRVTRDPSFGDSMERVMYNTVLGVKPLEPDGRAFYYADYNRTARRVYSDHVWPCCAGTLPQVAADYRISTYFRDLDAVFVNLYIPSTLRWQHDGADFALRQEGQYPLEDKVHFTITAAQPRAFGINLRIPEWAAGATVSVNGKPVAAEAGRFAHLRREWKNGDRIALTLPMHLRLEPVDVRHPETVALLRGPQVLFALGETPPQLTHKQMLAARQAERDAWVADSASGPVRFVPFTSVGDSPYTTYIG